MASPARYRGTCKSDNCKFGGSIQLGQMIVWNRSIKGQIYHAECAPTGWQVNPSPTPSNPNPAPIANEGQSPAHYDAQPENPSVQVHQNGDQLANVIAQAVAGLIKVPEPTATPLDETRVIELVKEHSSPIKATRVEYVAPSGEIKDLGLQHETFPLLLRLAQCITSDGHLNIMMVGPAGSGKTRAAMEVAKALGLPFSFDGGMDSPYPLIGYMDAKGEVVKTKFRNAYQNGGVHLLDESDCYSPNAALALNAALANGHCAFPDGMIERHPDFICLCAANTFGLGATNDYVGRNKLDAAFLDRFTVLRWDYDNALEVIACGNEKWAKRVQAVRTAIHAKGIKVVLSPRASMRGAAMLAQGIPQSEVERLELRKGLTDDQWNMVKEAN